MLSDNGVMPFLVMLLIMEAFEFRSSGKRMKKQMGMSDFRHLQARYSTGTLIHVLCSLFGGGPARPTLIWLHCSWCLVRFSTTIGSIWDPISTAARGIANVFWSLIQMEGSVGETHALRIRLLVAHPDGGLRGTCF